MKILKYLAIVLGTLIGAFSILVLIDNIDTWYLRNDNNDNKSYLIQHVNIIPMYKDTVLYNKTVYINNGIIEHIADTVKVDNVEVIDATNKYLIPGLIDMHVHVWDKYELGMYLANGVTTVRNMWGIPWHLRLKEEISNKRIIAPQFFTSSPKLTGPNYAGDDNIQLNSPSQARQKVSSYKDRGYDFIKSYNGLTEELFEAVIEQATLLGMDIAAHPSAEVPYAFHFNPQIVSIEHAEDIVQQPLGYKLDTAMLENVVKYFAEHPNHSFCPTLISYHNIYKMLTVDDVLSKEEVNRINPLIRMVDSQAQVERWQSTKGYDSTIIAKIKNQHAFHLLAIKKLSNSGVNIICGTDAGIGITYPGYSLHEELELYKAAGLSNFQVLETATINPSQTHKFLADIGTIEKGKRANLLLLKENPMENLENLKKPEIVFVQGMKLEKERLEEFEMNATERNNLLSTAIKYVEYLIIEK